jgi:anionic cell wall polymer biosynthesis LytR-Cps2A-Psr (LCP) family protein
VWQVLLESDLTRCYSVHVSKSRDNAVIISLPRDTLATIPAHTSSTGKLIGEQQAKLNAAYAWGDAPLLIGTIEKMSRCA